MSIQEYLDTLNKRYKTGISTEHTYRGDLQALVESIANGVMVTNEPTRVKCGAPDYIITKKNIPIGYIEAKDIGKDLNGKEHKEQFDRYKKSLPNLIITDYLTFQFFKDGQQINAIDIAEISKGKIISKIANFEGFTRLVKDFCTYAGQTITSPLKLSQMMANKAKLLAEVIEKALTSDEENLEDSTLKEQMKAFRDILIHDIDPKGFADIYAQTIAYGMFAARFHDPTKEDFSRQEAAELIPKSNPFLRKLFQYIAGYDLDDRIVWIVDALADIFRATDVKALLSNFGKSTQQNDPIIHFYETFLTEYDPKLRKSRGVWYTPEPVVNFIVRAVDDILKTEFNLPQGLADTTKTKILKKVPTHDKRAKDGYKEIEQEVHKVQILDPATGTGTFLAEVVKQIYNKFEGQQGIWSNYVENHLIPRLNGFELLMASYAMAHLKLELLLKETGYKATKDQRFKVFLTNSLEEHHKDTGTLFANWLSTEATEANHIKRDTPVMCVLGNPPYAVSSTNKNEWIDKLILDYKKDLDEKSYNSLSDDYVKFIRYGQHFIEKNGSGILAYISNNSFIDGIVFRQMRKHLLECFDKICILDLHGNTKKKEVCNDGSPDQNVFDIQQGVSINIFIKTGQKKKNELGELFTIDLQGKRGLKYSFLNESSINTCKWEKLDYQAPDYYFQLKDYSQINDYKKGLSVIDIFNEYSSGVQTEFDNFSIQEDWSLSNILLNDLTNLTAEEIISKYNLDIKNKVKVEKGINDVKINHSKIIPILYRPFDIKSCIYTGSSNGIMGRPRGGIMKHFIQKNKGLAVTKLNRGLSSGYYFSLNSISERHLLDTAGDSIGVFPLYLYPETNGQQTITQSTARTPNLNKEIVNQIAEKLGLEFVNEKDVSAGSTSKETFAPIDILDYIYAVLHSPTYREKYKEFLKIDFPRVPYPKDKNTFWQLVKLGSEIRQMHLLESPVVEKRITTFPQTGANIIDKVKYENEKVWINEIQYFEGVPQIAWEFYIGGYQPAQKWLKDRRGRELSFEDILHYQKIIVALYETDRLMKEIDRIDFE